MCRRLSVLTLILCFVLPVMLATPVAAQDDATRQVGAYVYSSPGCTRPTCLTPYVIVDICLRMLQPHELYRAQGFPASYIIDKGADGKPFTKTEQVHMCGNSVSPPPMAALAKANDPWQNEYTKSAAA